MRKIGFCDHQIVVIEDEMEPFDVIRIDVDSKVYHISWYSEE